MKKKGFPVKLLMGLLFFDVAVMVCYKLAERQTPLEGVAFFQAALMQPVLWLGLLFSVLQLYTWLKILERVKLSVAYPVASLSYPLTMLAAQWFFAEKLSGWVWVGGLLITLGVAIIGSFAKDEPEAMPCR